MSSFAEELRSLGKRRIGLPELRAAFLRAHPEALAVPDLRQLLLDTLRGLERDGAIHLPRKGWDRSGSPALPRTASLADALPARRIRAAQPWLPVVAFAADERRGAGAVEPRHAGVELAGPRQRQVLHRLCRHLREPAVAPPGVVAGVGGPRVLERLDERGGIEAARFLRGEACGWGGEGRGQRGGEHDGWNETCARHCKVTRYAVTS